jgi:hypothetical protein
METKKEAFKKFVIEQLKDFDYWREASPEGYAETIVDEAVKLFCQPAVMQRSELLTAFLKWYWQNVDGRPSNQSISDIVDAFGG